RNTTSIRIKNRCRNANRTMRWIILVPNDSEASSVLNRVRELQKQTAVSHHFLSRGKPLQNLRLPILALPDFDRPPPELTRPVRCIDERLVLVVPQHGRVGNVNRFLNSAGRDCNGAIHVLL